MKRTFLCFYIFVFSLISLYGQSNSEQTYSKEQVDSIVSVVKSHYDSIINIMHANQQHYYQEAELKLMVEEFARKNLDTYISMQNNYITEHDSHMSSLYGWMAIICGILCVFVPIIINRRYEKQLEAMANDNKDSLKRYLEEIKETAKTEIHNKVQEELKNFDEKVKQHENSLKELFDKQDNIIKEINNIRDVVNAQDKNIIDNNSVEHPTKDNHNNNDEEKISKYSAALPIVQQMAESGNPNFQNLLAFMYYYGYGVNKDLSTSASWYRKAASLGDVDGQLKLGYMYGKGIGVEKNYEEAIKWYKLAANSGNANAQFNLGVIFDNGWGVEKDYKEALKWFNKAADQGNSMAQVNIGYMYQNGNGVEKDYEKAVKWYKKAADQGNEIGQYDLAEMYENGTGVEKNMDQAIELYKKSAAKGNKEAKESLKRLEIE